MEMKGERVLPVPRAKAWEALNDPAVLQECIAGCESIELTGENQYQIVMTAAVGPVKAKFKGKLTLSDVDPPSSYRLTFEGQGGVAGFAKGGAEVALADEGSSTRLSYAVNASVGGKLAQIGSRLIDAAARKFADDFFNRFQGRLVQHAEASEDGVLPASREAAMSGSDQAVPGESIEGVTFDSGKTVTGSVARDANRRWLWWAAAAVAVVASIYYGSDRRS
jgi:uncharacterized protein